MPEKQEDSEAIIVRMYRDEGKGFSIIEKTLRIGDRAIRRVLVKHGVPIRPAPWQRQEEYEARLARDTQVRAVAEMLADVLPENARVEPKSPNMTIEEIARALCPYARVTVWLTENNQGDFIDGATFCAMHCESATCQTEPSRLREEAFRRYVARRIREADVIAKQDSGVKARRYRMELANETMLPEVNTREMEGAR